jgi:DNA mismatch repair protein MutS
MLSKGQKLNIVDGRHPVVEALSKQRFIPNDTLLDNDENRTMILTGPNMAGKSTYMRQTALITLMAHIGSFVPARSAEIPLTDKIFTRIGASDSLISDQSTFMVEMAEMANILKNATADSLLILDEIGRGTSTFDGLSIAWAVVEYITNTLKAKTMFATHYHELTELEGVIDGIKNYKVTVKEMQGGIVFLRKIMRGGANRSFGIEVAELAGVEKCVTDRAKSILKKLEKNDLAKKGKETLIKEEPLENKSAELENIIKDIDINNLSPMQAFNVLVDLYEKVKGEN